MNTDAQWATIPGNLSKSDREEFAALAEWEQRIACDLASRLYDGTRTVSRCWKEAIRAVLDTRWS